MLSARGARIQDTGRTPGGGLFFVQFFPEFSLGWDTRLRGGICKYELQPHIQLVSDTYLTVVPE